MRVRGGRRRRLLDLLVHALPGSVDSVAGVGAATALRAAITGSQVGLGGGCPAHHASPVVEVQGALIHGLVLTVHGDGDLSRKNELQPLPGAPNVGFVGSDGPKFFHGVES